MHLWLIIYQMCTELQSQASSKLASHIAAAVVSLGCPAFLCSGGPAPQRPMAWKSANMAPDSDKLRDSYHIPPEWERWCVTIQLLCMRRITIPLSWVYSTTMYSPWTTISWWVLLSKFPHQ